MKITVLSVGRPRRRELEAVYLDYAGRVERMGVAWTSAFVREERAGGRYSDAHVRDREGRALLDARPRRATVVALDPGGRERSTPELAEVLERWATPEVAILVGGPLGLSAEVLAAAPERWSLSRLTLPHELARVVAAEALYRALTVLRGIPYHK